MKRIINFSGGLSSAYMTILEYNSETDYVIFCDTGREHPKTYKFINDFEAFEQIPIIRLGGEDSFAKYLEKNNNNVPNMMKRSCTRELKINVARRWCRKNVGMEYINMIGFRSDEMQRIIRNRKRWKRVVQKFPLYERDINKYKVNKFFRENRKYKLEIPSILGNCTLCFMKGKNNIISILKHYPELAAKWIADEEKSKHTYLNGISIKECLEIAMQPDLFSVIELEKLTPAYGCSCTQ